MGCGQRRLDSTPTSPCSPRSSRRRDATAFVSAYVLDGAWGLDRGFDVYRDPFHPGRVQRLGDLERPGGGQCRRGVVEGGRRIILPRFAWVHLTIRPSRREHAGWRGDPYRGEVHYADTLVGRSCVGPTPGTSSW